MWRGAGKVEKIGKIGKAKKWALGWMLLFFVVNAPAADLFASGWGSAFDASPEGQLFFTAMEVFGIWTCIKSLILVYRYAHHKTQHGYWTCTTIFLAGCLLYFMHETLNLLYQSF